MSDLLLRLRTIPNTFYEARLAMVIAAARIEALEAALREIRNTKTDWQMRAIARAALDKDDGK
jgi:hypothetical protein